MLIGHHSQREAFMEGVRSGRMHHAWLLAGPQGVGKRAFADAAALRLLAGGDGPFEVDAEHRAARLMRAGSHMDWRVLTREANDAGKLRATIAVDQVRELQPVLRGTPALGDWRVVTVDAADELNRNAANALLKNLEEPPKGTVFFLVSHAPARLLPTIRSRCRALRFQPLSDAEVAAVLRGQGEADDALVRLAEGRPGLALAFAGADLGAVEAAVERQLGDASPVSAARFAGAFAAAGAAGRFDALCRLVPARIAAAARARPTVTNLRAQAEAEALAADALGGEYARPQVAFGLARLLGQVETETKKAA